MDEKTQNDIIKILMKSGRMDLVAILLTLFEEIDSDFDPDELDILEPHLEYNEGNASEEDLEFNIDKDGFHYLS
tara:strand:+ start:138 stop:359 length:222 start_codon:yes stop_codon:yes gene_type:complete